MGAFPGSTSSFQVLDGETGSVRGRPGRAKENVGGKETEQIQTREGLERGGRGENIRVHASPINLKIKGEPCGFELLLKAGGEPGEGGPSFYTKFRKKKASYILNIHNKVTSSQCDSRFIYKEPSTGYFSFIQQFAGETLSLFSHRWPRGPPRGGCRRVQTGSPRPRPGPSPAGQNWGGVRWGRGWGGGGGGGEEGRGNTETETRLGTPGGGRRVAPLQHQFGAPVGLVCHASSSSEVSVPVPAPLVSYKIDVHLRKERGAPAGGRREAGGRAGGGRSGRALGLGRCAAGARRRRRHCRSTLCFFSSCVIFSSSELGPGACCGRRPPPRSPRPLSAARSPSPASSWPWPSRLRASSSTWSGGSGTRPGTEKAEKRGDSRRRGGGRNFRGAEEPGRGPLLLVAASPPQRRGLLPRGPPASGLSKSVSIAQVCPRIRHQQTACRCHSDSNTRVLRLSPSDFSEEGKKKKPWKLKLSFLKDFACLLSSWK